MQEIARQHGNALNAAEIRQVFEECDLDKSQLLGVLKYLTSQGILIEGLETAGEEAKEPEHKKIPLTAEEKAYLKNYLEELPVVDEVDADSVFEALAAGDQRDVYKRQVFYCDRGGASMAAAREFVRRGYRTRSVIGGFTAYRGRNLVSGDR